MTLMVQRISGFVSQVTTQEDKVYFASIKNPIYIQYFVKKPHVQKSYKNTSKGHFY